MERRDVLKSISLALGYTVTPAALSGLLASCQADDEGGWKPLFLDPAGAIIVRELGEAFLPETDTPGAKAVGAHVFVDLFLAKVALPADRALFEAGMSYWKAAFEKRTGNNLTEAAGKDFTSSLEHYFGVSEQRQSEIRELINAPEPRDPAKREAYMIYKFLFSLKRLIMLGFYASEAIGEHVLSYLPVPGRYDACIPADQVGNAWSL